MARVFGLKETCSPALVRRLEHSFRRGLARQPALAFGPARPGTLRDLERRWWRAVVWETVQDVATVVDFDGFFAALYDHYSKSRAWDLEPGGREALEELRKLRVPVAIVSNFDSRLPGLLGSLGISHLLSTVVFSSGVGLAKPDPGIFREALARLSLRPEGCCHVGDDPQADVQGAERAGIRPVLYDPAGRHRGLKIERVQHLSEVVERLFERR